MKRDFAYLAAVLLTLWACGDSSSTDPILFSEHWSSAVDVPSSAEVATSSSRVAESSSARIVYSSFVEPIPQSSSSYRQLNVYDEDTTRVSVYRFLYPVADGALDTGFFSGGECSFEASGLFSCRQRQCMSNVGGVIHIPTHIGMVGIRASQKDDPNYFEYFHQNTEITRLVDVNFGDSALTNYIPYADIPEFDTEDALKRLSVLPATPCTTLEHFSGNYRLTAEGLPEGIILYNDGEGIEMSMTEPSTEPYTKLLPKEEIDSMLAHVPEVNAYGLLSFFPDGFESERRYAENMDYDYKNPEFKATVNEYGCAVLSVTYNKEYLAGRCEGWTIPEKKKDYSARLLNISDKVPAEPIHWKLIYKDQYGRGGTLEITTTFE